MPARSQKIEPIDLEAIYRRERPGLAGLIAGDPVEFVHGYREALDKEIAGFLASQFAYGKIEVMKRFLKDLFERMGESPARFVERGDWSRLGSLYYRFHKSDEIRELFVALRCIVTRHGSIGELFRSRYQGNVREAIWSLRQEVAGNERDLLFFFPKRLPQSPLKRWSLYLRWMVRKDKIDQGLWSFVERRDLVVPLDTHLFKIGRCLGWTQRRSPTWRAAEDITAALREACPKDPLRYDFFLCHRVGIAAGCSGRKTESCTGRCMLMK